MTLPASASMGDQIEIVDAGQDSSTNNITINRNSHNINADTQDLVLSTNGSSFVLVYVNTDTGWTSMYRTSS